MGMSVGSSNPNAVKNDINVTPLIDVLLVLLIIFLVTLPLLMKMETLEVPRKLDENNEQLPEDAVLLMIRVRADTTMSFCENDKKPSHVTNDDVKKGAFRHTVDGTMVDLREKLNQMKNGKVIFVDFDDGVPWKTVVATMDSIRALASDASHDEVKVALRVREELKAGQPKGPCEEDAAPAQ